MHGYAAYGATAPNSATDNAALQLQHMQLQQQQLQQYQQQQQHIDGPLSAADVWSREIFGEAVDPSVQSELEAQSTAPRIRGDGTNSVSVDRSFNLKVSPAELMANPDIATQAFGKTMNLTELREAGVRLIPKSIRVTSIQNGLPFAVGFRFSAPGSDRSTMKINCNCVTSDEHLNVDLVIPEGAHAPIACGKTLYVTDKDGGVDLSPFQNMHNVSKDELELGVTARNDATTAPYADVIVKSAVHQIAMLHAEQFRLDGNNVFYHPQPKVTPDGRTYSLCRLPLHVVSASLNWGNEMIDSLPFQDPEAVVATMVRLDGKAFDADMDNGMGSTMDDLNTRVPVHFSLEEIYQPVSCSDDSSVAPQ